MRARLIAVGTRPPSWVREAYADYTRRLGSRLKLTLLEIEPGPRSAGQSPRKAVEAEARKLTAALRPAEWVVALDERGTQMSTRELAEWLAGRMREGRDLAFLIGGPDGFAAEVLARSDTTLSLSRLTLPHALVRVVLAEQLYRAMSILTHHPYHRDGCP
ncbi:MAG TPA: 23S rRNA (pseudouridine(1915)-N(3))-methyltransferase RlmH [Steroidobacteraceae bacterium]|nr:23S rRNA (pseudouridine(1915)-N(3))-methyltransferase RlmH [Steroidobacteraceae bacterium]